MSTCCNLLENVHCRVLTCGCACAVRSLTFTSLPRVLKVLSCSPKQVMSFMKRMHVLNVLTMIHGDDDDEEDADDDLMMTMLKRMLMRIW